MRIVVDTSAQFPDAAWYKADGAPGMNHGNPELLHGSGNIWPAFGYHAGIRQAADIIAVRIIGALDDRTL